MKRQFTKFSHSFYIRKNTQRLNVYQEYHPKKKKKRQTYRFLFLSVKHRSNYSPIRNWVNPKI